MTRIVTTTYRYKPPPKRKGRKLAEITGPAVVTTKKSRRTVLGREAAAEVKASPSLGGGATLGNQSDLREGRATSSPAHRPENRQHQPMMIASRRSSPRPKRQCSTSVSSSRWRSLWPQPKPRTSSTG